MISSPFRTVFFFNNKLVLNKPHIQTTQWQDATKIIWMPGVSLPFYFLLFIWNKKNITLLKHVLGPYMFRSIPSVASFSDALFEHTIVICTINFSCYRLTAEGNFTSYNLFLNVFILTTPNIWKFILSPVTPHIHSDATKTCASMCPKSIEKWVINHSRLRPPLIGTLFPPS